MAESERSSLSAHFSFDRHLRWPIISSGLLIVAVAVWLGLKIPNGILNYPDELLTAERTREMLLQGRGSVYFNFHHTFAKPPLQYWLTTLTLPRFQNPTTAVRLWPLLYGLLTAIAVGGLAFLIDPKRPWLIPLSIAIFVSCPLFSTEATRALLDTGLMFFTTAAIGFAQLARRNPAWWPAVAVTCWLGALQKIPIIFLVWLIIVLVRLSAPGERERIRRGWLTGSALLAAALILIWPLVQFWKYQMPPMKAFAGDDLNALFGQRQLGARPYFEVLDGLLLSGWAGGAFALIAAIAFLFSRRRDVPAAVSEMSILSLALIVLAVLCNFRSVRYVLPIVPCLCVVLAFFLLQLLEQTGKVRAGAIAFIALLVSSGFLQAEIKMHHRGRDASHEQRVAQKLGEWQRTSASTVLIEPSERKRDLRSTAFYLFHGNLRFAVKRWTVEQLRESSLPQPVVGVCLARDFASVQTIFPEARAELVHDQFICWQAAPSL